MAAVPAPPETLADYLKISWMQPLLQTYDWGFEHISSHITDLRSRPALSTAPLPFNALVDSFLHADEEQQAVLQAAMGQLKGHCRARAKTRWHEWRTKVEAVLQEGLQQHHDAFATEQGTIKEHIARMRRHRETMAARMAFLKEECKRKQAGLLSQTQRSQLVEGAKTNIALKSALQQKEARAAELTSALATVKDNITAASASYEALLAEQSQLTKSLMTATARVSSEHVSMLGRAYDAYSRLVAWRPRLVRAGLLEIDAGRFKMVVRFSGNMTTAAVEDVSVVSVVPEAHAVKCTASKYASLREVIEDADRQLGAIAQFKADQARTAMLFDTVYNVDGGRFSLSVNIQSCIAMTKFTVQYEGQLASYPHGITAVVDKQYGLVNESDIQAIFKNFTGRQSCILDASLAIAAAQRHA